MTEATLDQQFVEYVVKNLVEHPDDVVLERSIDDRGVLLKLSVHPDDMGKIIGKAGSTAKAIRTLLRVVGAKTDERLNLKIVDPDENETDSAREDTSEDTREALPAEPAEAVEPVVELTEAEQEAESIAADADTEEEEASEPASKDVRAKAREGIEDLDLDL